MKVAKTNGKYVKPRITATTKVPLFIWGSLVFTLALGVVFVAISTGRIQSGPAPELELARKHSYRVVAVGDIACSPNEINFNEGNGVVAGCQQKAVGRAIASEHADAVMLLGDIQYPTGEDADYTGSFVPYYRNILTPIYVVAGNHDYGNGARAPSLDGYKKAFDTYFPHATYQKEGKTYYDFNLGQWKFYVLDSNCAYVGGCEKGSEQADWLTSKVKVNQTKCSVAMWHHPVYTSGQHRNPPDTNYGREFWSILADSGNDLVLNGHDHDYERFAPVNGMREFVAGTGGYSVRKIGAPYADGSEKRIDDQFGYLYLELFPGRYTWQFKTVTGEVLDEGTDECR
jgi:predicted phosphodiesterase